METENESRGRKHHEHRCRGTCMHQGGQALSFREGGLEQSSHQCSQRQGGGLKGASQLPPPMQDNTIDFLEYVAALNLVLRGTLEHKLKWTFKIYDKDRNGCIDRQELLDMVEVSVTMRACWMLKWGPRAWGWEGALGSFRVCFPTTKELSWTSITKGEWGNPICLKITLLPNTPLIKKKNNSITHTQNITN